MNKKSILAIIIILIVIVLLFLLLKPKFPTPTPEDVSNTDISNTTSDISTQEQDEANTATDNSISAKIGQTISLYGVSGTVVELIEDSRCPMDVQCIQAGTVKVKVNFVFGELNQNVTLTLGKELTMSGRSVTLVGVNPEKKSTTNIASSDYVFTFLIK